MRSIIRLAALCALPVVTACASVSAGTSQSITINTNPPGAMCGLYREGFRIGIVPNTPGSATVEKTKNDIEIVCVREGHADVQHHNRSQAEAMTFGNLLIGGGIGWAIDSASGADNKYDSPVNITLVPVAPGSPATALTLPASLPYTTREAARAAAAARAAPPAGGTQTQP